eukprot:580791-Amphidinium_carterae.3
MLSLVFDKGERELVLNVHVRPGVRQRSNVSNLRGKTQPQERNGVLSEAATGWWEPPSRQSIRQTCRCQWAAAV